MRGYVRKLGFSRSDTLDLRCLCVLCRLLEKTIKPLVDDSTDAGLQIAAVGNACQPGGFSPCDSGDSQNLAWWISVCPQAFRYLQLDSLERYRGVGQGLPFILACSYGHRIKRRIHEPRPPTSPPRPAGKLRVPSRYIIHARHHDRPFSSMPGGVLLAAKAHQPCFLCWPTDAAQQFSPKTYSDEGISRHGCMFSCANTRSRRGRVCETHQNCG